MLSINQKHHNIPQIAESFTLNQEFNEDYRFYGLKQENNPAIKIDIDLCAISRQAYDNNSKLKSSLEEFLNKHNISVEFNENDDGGEYGIRIGFRKDLRENIILSACLLETIIQVIEGKLKLNEKSIIPKCPKFS